MSVQEIQSLAQRFADAFDKRDMKTVLEMLSDDVEVFDRVPYRFDSKQLFAKYLNEAIEGIASMSFGFRQPSCRVYNDNVGIVNAYDMFMGSTKDEQGPDHSRANYPGLRQASWAMEDRELSFLSDAACLMTGLAAIFPPSR